MDRNRRSKKRIGLERVRIIYSNVIQYASENPEISRRQIEVARRILLKFNIHLPYPYKLFFCNKCKSPIIPGVDSKIRISNVPKLHVRVICLKCGGVYRKFISRAM
ncbi:MAG: ribonuclease P protein component 4 [Nitrososphaeria archaeon]